MLYALEQQATDGPCKNAKPWGWNVVESAKHEAWSSLADMPGMEAMRHFVQSLEEDQVCTCRGRCALWRWSIKGSPPGCL